MDELSADVSCLFVCCPADGAAVSLRDGRTFPDGLPLPGG